MKIHIHKKPTFSDRCPVCGFHLLAGDMIAIQDTALKHLSCALVQVELERMIKALPAQNEPDQPDGDQY